MTSMRAAPGRVIAPAEAMNRQRANALLKTLEEPRRDACLVLVTPAVEPVARTLRSRCQAQLARPTAIRRCAGWSRDPGSVRGSALLAVAGGAPLQALAPGADVRGSRRARWRLRSLEATAAAGSTSTRCAADMRKEAPCRCASTGSRLADAAVGVLRTGASGSASRCDRLP